MSTLDSADGRVGTRALPEIIERTVVLLRQCRAILACASVDENGKPQLWCQLSSLHGRFIAPAVLRLEHFSYGSPAHQRWRLTIEVSCHPLSLGERVARIIR